jgi:hypothetical protein
MRNLILVVVLLSLQFISCRNLKDSEIEKNKEDYISKIIIQNYPSFHLPSLFVVDIKNQEIIFQRIGQREFIEVTPLPEGRVIRTLAPKSFAYRIDSSSFQFLKDSIVINFSFEDFEDKHKNVDDGIGNSILYIFESGKIEDVELSNSYTENQIKLLKHLLILTEKVHTDSISRIYLNRLKKYYD